MKKIFLAICSTLALVAFTTGGCTRTPKQTKGPDTMAGWRYKHGCRSQWRTAGIGRPVCVPVTATWHSTRTSYDKALNTRASALTVKDCWRR